MKLLLLLFLVPVLSVIGVAAETSAPKRVAFVFDDGPVPEETPRLLRILAEAGARVSFSYVGRAVEANPALARAALEAGHEINNHSFTHPNLTKLDDAALRDELVRTAAAIERATGARPTWLWAPFLASDARVEKISREATGVIHFPYPQFHFISTDDWNKEVSTADSIQRAATTDIRDGTVILCHEWRTETVDRMPAILAELKRQGCTFVTFSDLVAK